MTTELEAARLVRAALRLIRDSFSDACALDATVSRWQQDIGNIIEGLEASAPPWEPARPQGEIPWSQVACGDKVLAPNGQWYPVDSVARIGDKVSAMLSAGGNLIRTDRTAGERVKVERGATGQALDIFAAGGINLETIKSGVAA